jgi:FecR protein/Putative zinc-finger
MFTKHISTQLAAHLDGQLTGAELREAEEHLRTCVRCREEAEQVRSGMTIIKSLESVEAPDELWSSIEAGLQPVPKRPRWQWVLTPAVVLILAGIVWWRSASSWIETNSTSRKTISIGQIGTVEIEPNTRVRVVKDQPAEHRLTLARGEIRATISAPPKLFFVDTPSGTAVDLGCAYSLTTEEDGSDLLRVTRGWVSLQWKGLESLVPAGASCRTRPKAGPGIPYFDDASAPLKRALETEGPLAVILTESRKRDTLTLWHLLSRVDFGDRARVFDRITALTPLPAGVTRERALALDRQTLDHWREELAWTW